MMAIPAMHYKDWQTFRKESTLKIDYIQQLTRHNRTTPTKTNFRLQLRNQQNVSTYQTPQACNNKTWQIIKRQPNANIQSTSCNTNYKSAANTHQNGTFTRN
jgi:hypothetical protein